ncbi:holocytochrome-c synthase [Malassezia cuniculi]|uniref:Holocytochrome c-type synthase n=1 Tax=Malassezia cuniculi TaxID=948313 RepID=A0AAF0J7P4_9BASI|nr:holocytochrome-c synthase [Malassezia cuniculi]
MAPAASMGATQSIVGGADTPGFSAPRRRTYNNQDAVAAMLLHKHRTIAESAPRTTIAEAEPPAACPMHASRGGAMAPAPLNPLNNMPELSQEPAPTQRIALSRERTVSSIPRAPTSAAPGDSPYGPAACPIDHSQLKKEAPSASADAKCPIDHSAAPAKPDGEAACPVDHSGSSSGSEPSHWEYPSPQQFYNALVRKGWETPEESVEMMVLIHNFLNERAWNEVIEWERLAGTDVSTLQLARFQGRPGTLSPRARMYQMLAWAMPDRFSSEPPFDRHDWIVRRAPTPANPKGEEIRYVIDYYSVPDDSDEDEAAFNLDVRPAIDSFDAIRMRWKKTMQEYESGELFAPFRSEQEEPK